MFYYFLIPLCMFSFSWWLVSSLMFLSCLFMCFFPYFSVEGALVVFWVWFYFLWFNFFEFLSLRSYDFS